MSCKDLVRQANSSRIKYAYSALVEIRKKYTKSKGVQELVEARLVRRLVELVRTRETLPDNYKTKVVDISLSILANMCMMPEAREQMLKTSGLTDLGELFLESEVKEVLHRTCRCVANILLSPKSWEPVHALAILEKLEELLNNTDDDDCKQTYIRTIRLLGQTPKHVSLLLRNNLVYTAAKHLDSDSSDVRKAAFRCVQSLSFHGCTAQFARQIAKSGKVGFLLAQLPDESQEMFPLICKLAEHEELRPQFGNDGGIASFIEYFQSPEPPYTELRVEILNVLCLCCQESVNRVKLRENNALAIFLDALKDEKLRVLHERIVSAFVCFMYDEQSFGILLDGGLVEIVKKMLVQYMNLSSGEVDQECKPALPAVDVTEPHQPDTVPHQPDAESHQPDTESHQSDTESHQPDTESHQPDTESHQPDVSEERQDGQDLKVDLKKPQDLDFDEKEKVCIDQLNVVSEKTLPDEKTVETSTDDAETLDKPVENKEQKQRPKYSINSPTYESVAHELDDSDTVGKFVGPKCIESFTPPHTLDLSSYPYSPLSNSSYYSPSGSSPDMSPGSSSGFSPRGGHSPRSSHQKRVLFNLDSSSEDGSLYPKHKYTGLTWSPDSSPERATSVCDNEKPSSSGNMKSSSCPDFTSSGKATASDSRTMSITESTNMSITESTNMSITESNSEPLTTLKRSESLRLSVENDLVFVDLENQYSPVVNSLDFEEYLEAESPVNKDPIDATDKDPIDATDKDPIDATDKDPIDATDKSPIDATDKVPDSNPKRSEEGNLEHVPKKGPKRKKKEKRKRNAYQNVRFEMNVLQLLSRVQDIDPILYIVSHDMMNCLGDYLCRMESPLTRVAKIFSRTFRNRLCFERLVKLKVPALLFDKLLPERSIPAAVSQLVVLRKYNTRIPHWPEIFEFHQTNHLVTERFSITEEEVDRQPNKRSRFTDSGDDCKRSRKLKDAQQTDVCCTEKCQVAFLEDLATVADSEFGCGVIERIVLTSSGGLPIEMASYLPLISWTKRSQRFYFKHLNLTDQLLKVLEAKDCKTTQSKLITTIVLGFGFLARTSDIGIKYFKALLPSVAWRKIQNSAQSDNSARICKVDELDPATNVPQTVFVVDGEKITASKTILTENSQFFAAMLNGSYKEANLPEIPLPETSKFVMKYMVHYTYGCTVRCCSIMLDQDTAEVSRETLQRYTDLLSEADKHCLPKLHDDLIRHVIDRFIVPECALPVFEYAVVTDHIQLQKAAVACLLADSELTSLRKLFCECLESRFSKVFLQTVFEILTDL